MKRGTMRTIHRQIAAVIVLSNDDHILMGRRDPKAGGTYATAWHLPGGGVNEGEHLIVAALREVAEETGLQLRPVQLKAVGPVGFGESIKTLKTGEKVMCKMEFNRFEVRLPQAAYKLAAEITPGDDLVDLRWIPLKDIEHLELVPGTLSFYKELGYITH